MVLRCIKIERRFPKVKEKTPKSEEQLVYEPSDSVKTKATIKTMEEYRELYQKSVKDPEKFWGELAEELDWKKKWNKVLEWDFSKPEIKWFVGGKLNASYNCLDKHLNTWRRNKVALIWQGEPLEENRSFTYQQLYYHVCKFANVLKKLGVKKGDRVSIYLPMIPELPIAMLACARIGAIHSVVFGGFSSEALRDRINDCGSRILICADGYYRGGKIVRSKDGADQALESCPLVKDVIVVKRANAEIPMKKGRDYWWHDEMAAK